MKTDVSERSLLPFGSMLASLVLAAGCALGEGKISDQLPNGVVIPIGDLPNEVMNAEDRLRLPAGTKIQKCNNGCLYRFDFPNGSIWMKDSKGEAVGGII